MHHIHRQFVLYSNPKSWGGSWASLMSIAHNRPVADPILDFISLAIFTRGTYILDAPHPQMKILDLPLVDYG